MAAGARCSAHLAMIDALTEHNHFAGCAFGNGKSDGGRASVWMRALRRLRGHFHRIASRSGWDWTRRDLCGAAFGAALINNAVDPPAHIVGDVERTVRSHSQATGTMF